MFCSFDFICCFVSKFLVCFVVCGGFVDSVSVPGFVACVDGSLELSVEPGCLLGVLCACCVWDVVSGKFL